MQPSCHNNRPQPVGVVRSYTTTRCVVPPQLHLYVGCPQPIPGPLTPRKVPSRFTSRPIGCSQPALAKVNQPCKLRAIMLPPQPRPTPTIPRQSSSLLGLPRASHSTMQGRSWGTTGPGAPYMQGSCHTVLGYGRPPLARKRLVKGKARGWCPPCSLVAPLCSTYGTLLGPRGIIGTLLA